MVDQLLGGLFGGQDDEDDDRRRGRARDFVSRYEQGAPHEGYDDDEVIQNYRSVERHMSDDDFEEAATGAFGRMSAQDRTQMRDMMQQRGGGRVAVQSDDPRELARAASRYRREESGGGGLLSMFGMGGDGGGGGDLMSAARGGGGGGGMMDNPMAKAALAGVAAMAMKKMVGR